MTWPTKPTYIVAQNAYQTLLELKRQHPEDVELPATVKAAEDLRDWLWHEEIGRWL